MFINLKVLRKIKACKKGIKDFKKHFGNQSVSVDEVINKSIELELDYADWLIDKFSEHIVELDWSKLSGYNWQLLLRYQPQLSEYCDWSKLDGDNWSVLLSYQPQLSEYCDWSLLNGDDWYWLLHRQPQLSEYCDWSKLDSWDWYWLLRHQPQFEKYKPTS